MYKTILIPTDGSQLAKKAVEHGLALSKAASAAVIFVTATADWSATQMAELVERGVPEPVQDYEKKAVAWASQVLADCEARARTMGVSCTTVHVKDKAAADAIVETAKSKGCDLIVMSSHGRGGVGRLLSAAWRRRCSPTVRSQCSSAGRLSATTGSLGTSCNGRLWQHGPDGSMQYFRYWVAAERSTSEFVRHFRNTPALWPLIAVNLSACLGKYGRAGD